MTFHLSLPYVIMIAKMLLRQEVSAYTTFLALDFIKRSFSLACLFTVCVLDILASSFSL